MRNKVILIGSLISVAMFAVGGLIGASDREAVPGMNPYQEEKWQE